MEEEPALKEELNSELTGLNKGEKARKKKLIIGLSVGVGILIVVAIIIIIVVETTKGSSEKKKKKKKKKVIRKMIYQRIQLGK